MTELFVRIAFYVGAAYMVATAIIGVCAIWWYAMKKIRECAHEAYLMADLHLWMKRHQKDKP